MERTNTVLCLEAKLFLYLILVNVRVCGYDDSLLHTSLWRAASYDLCRKEDILFERHVEIKWNRKARSLTCTADLWDVSGGSSDWGTTGDLWGNGLRTGHGWAIFVLIRPINCHLKEEDNKNGTVNNLFWVMFHQVQCKAGSFSMEPLPWSSQTCLLWASEGTFTKQTWLPIAETDLGWAAAGAPTFDDS